MGGKIADAVEPEHGDDPAREQRTEDLRVVVGVGASRAGRRDARLVAQDLRLEPLELRAGLDAQLLDEARAGVLVGVERFRLPARAVEREHELAAERLAERVLSDQRLELADDVAVPPELEIRLDPLLERDESKLLEPSDLGLRELLERELGERRAAPELERACEELAPLLGACAARVPERELEPLRVDLLGCDAEDVSRRPRLEHVRLRARAAAARSSSEATSSRSSAPPRPRAGRRAGRSATTRPASSSRAASSARCFCPPSATGPDSPSTSSGPRIRNSSVTGELAHGASVLYRRADAQLSTACPSSGNRSAG